MFSRCLLLHLLVIGACAEEAKTTISERLKTELKQGYSFAPESNQREQPVFARETEPAPDADAILYLAPIKVTAPRTFYDDLIRATRQAAEAQQAKKFSPLTGGLIYSNRKGPREINLGIWPQLVPAVSGPTKKEFVAISVDILRIKWQELSLSFRGVIRAWPIPLLRPTPSACLAVKSVGRTDGSTPMVHGPAENKTRGSSPPESSTQSHDRYPRDSLSNAFPSTTPPPYRRITSAWLTIYRNSGRRDRCVQAA